MPRPRPADLSAREVGFQRREAVRWLAPGVLVTTGLQSVIAAIFGSYADKRELQGSLDADLHDHGDGTELWFDFVADLGDGFDATYSVASLLAADHLDVDGHRLPRGGLLVMGGDEVYPSASTSAYEDRSKGVYRAAFPAVEGEPPALYALPGNHDWYDGLTAFLRVFAQQRSFGGWQTAQARSYFAIRLPNRWWLLAIDTQFDDYVDAPQLEYFRRATAEMAAGDAVILCTSKPAWVAAGSGGETKGYDTIEFFDREIVRAKGAETRVMLSGDKHHYARFAERDGTGRQRVTCGLGGAYLAATHRLPETLCLPPAESRVREPSPPAFYDLETRYPDRDTSRRLAAGITALPWRNRTFWALTGAFQTVMTLAVLYGIVQTDIGARGFFGLLGSWAPAAIIGVVLVVAGTTFARMGGKTKPAAARFAGVLHAFAHIGLSVGWSFLVVALYKHALPDGAGQDWATLAVVGLGTPVVIGFVDAEIVAIYLLLASRANINLNEVMAGQSIEDYKGFLRLRIAANGDLTIHPVRLDRVCRDWRAQPAADATAPWFAPGTPLAPHLIEPPITVPRVSG
ncbi:hypothetical protein CLV40_10746 [Actinokineospora auranticolor]|uniref:Calcineurin-like phosphoesterase family protein n=1 Tax=Actinokineospora auranticolor TaxID=155976 RepID=A0A2S6GQD6_9PSEU|nr:hypothetical protein CLV40_10746 [Actinokineospora auranticolor]